LARLHVYGTFAERIEVHRVCNHGFAEERMIDKVVADEKPALPPVSQRPRIGVTLMLDQAVLDDHVARYGMNRTYFEAIRRAGGIPIPLAPGDPSEMECYLDPPSSGADLPAAGVTLDGLCLAGGGDPDPALYGQARRPGCEEPEPERDAMELALLHAARSGRMPILAICRGIQILNVAWGGTLIQDIERERPEALGHRHVKGFPRSRLAHDIRIEAGTRLHDLLGAVVHPVNSLHHQALDRLAPELRVTARAQDGIVEAVELQPPADRERFLIGVQFHPEDLSEHASIGRLFAAFVEACARYRASRTRAGATRSTTSA
jgi:putative glutamine amidotransferase